MTDEWDELCDRFRQLRFSSSIKRIAAELPASRATVHRIMEGKVRRPTLAVRVAVQRLVEEEEQSCKLKP